MKPYIPGIATSKEKRIHEFLNDKDVFLIDVKGFIEDLTTSKFQNSSNCLLGAPISAEDSSCQSL